MPFEWLKSFQQNMRKADDYTEKTLASYRLGMRANGSIAGISIALDPDGCAACKKIDAAAIYSPDDAPHLPLPDCDRKQRCGCVYRPVMSYQVRSNDNEL